MFDCKQVIFAQRTQTIYEGTPIVTKTTKNNLHHGDSKCTALHYWPPDEMDAQRRVIAHFEDGTVRMIFDIDEIMGLEVNPEQ